MDDATPQPTRLVPFGVAAERAREAALAWLAGQALAPGDLRQAAVIEGMHDTYVPFLSFTARVFCPFTAFAGYAAQDGSRGRSLTDWEEYAGVVEQRLSHVLVPATEAPLRDILQRLIPWPTDAAVACPPTLDGVPIEPCASPGSDAVRLARAEMTRRMRILCIGEIPGHRHRALRMHPEFHEEESTLVLLPAWRVDYRYDGRTYHLWVNGCTACVHGDAPTSRWTAAAILVAGAGIVAATLWAVLSVLDLVR